MAKIESSAVSYFLECASCTHEWEETAETRLGNCPSCGAPVEKSSGRFSLAPGHEPSAPPKRRPSGSWGWAEATQNKP
jgi:DNA-directed RNA polymerase subunit RPC12/RpoP